jgi:hypothetical protein
LFSKLAILTGALAISIPSAWPNEPLHETTVQLLPCALDGSVSLENTDGSIHVYGWKEGRVKLVALRKAYTAPRLRQIRVETSAQPGSITAKTVIPIVAGIFADRSGTVDYTVVVPETAKLKLKLVNGEVELHGLRGGSARVELVNGRITALNCFARLQVRSVNGILEAFNEWWENLPAAVDFAIQHGRIGVKLPAAARFRVDAQTAKGRIGNGFGFHATAKAGPGQSLEAATGPDAPVSFVLRTGGGNISLDAIR